MQIYYFKALCDIMTLGSQVAMLTLDQQQTSNRATIPFITVTCTHTHTHTQKPTEEVFLFEMLEYLVPKFCCTINTHKV
jgi:hypothetical protein